MYDQTIWKNFLHIEIWGSHSVLYMISCEFYSNQNRLSYALSNIHCTSAIAIKNVFKSQNRMTVVQVSEMEPRGHCGCGLGQVFENLNFLNYIKARASLSFSKEYLLAVSCNLMVSRSPLVTRQPFQTPTNPYLKSTLTFNLQL